MPAIAKRATSAFSGEIRPKDAVAVVECDFGDGRSGAVSTAQKRLLRSRSTAEGVVPILSPGKRKSPRRCMASSPNSPSNGIVKEFGGKIARFHESPLKKSTDDLFVELKWNPRDSKQMKVVKEALHVSTSPSTVLCREEELRKVLDFCMSCMDQHKSGSLYICGCPGTGKTMVVEKVKRALVAWSNEVGVQQPDVFFMNCTSLVKTSDIFSKILQRLQPQKKINDSAAALRHLQKLSSQDLPGKNMMVLIIDELDYLITKDRVVLHELFMLTMLPFSRCILIGIANAIDLADRFLPRLQAMNCKPTVLTFQAYSKDQILKILQERLLKLPYTVFQPQALELCARKVAAASGDMRKALCVCRSAIEILEAEIKENSSRENMLSPEQECVPATKIPQEVGVVQVNHMAVAVSKTYRSPVVETIQSLPQHQQIILCSAVRLFRGGKKEATVKELNKSYEELCKSEIIRPVGIFEMSSMCRILHDQGLLKIGQVQRVEKVTLKIDAADVAFALQGVRFFRNCLQ